MPAAAPLPHRPAHRAGHVTLWVCGLLTGAILGGPALAQSTAGGTNQDKSCAAFGPGFQKVPGSDSCVRTRANVRADGYVGGALSNAPNQGMGNPSGGSTSTTTDSSDPWKSAR